MTQSTRQADSIKAIRLVDLHFHGAFGIDLMTAGAKDFNLLTTQLRKQGIHAFCPTTLSEETGPLLQTVTRLGQWIQTQWKNPSKSKAFPIGIHLEGPFLSLKARGAHQATTLRSVGLPELEKLWIASHQTICLITLAPEEIKDLKAIAAWAKKRKITLSAGHSVATFEEAQAAFLQGFSGITHAFNAMPFHHRDPGLLGAALQSKVHVEVIIDQIHVHPAAIRLLAEAFPTGLCFVSDCAPAACTRKGWHPFGPLKVEYKDGASRLKGGSLAGGGKLLDESLRELLRNRDYAGARTSQMLQKEARKFAHTHPLAALDKTWTKRVPK